MKLKAHDETTVAPPTSLPGGGWPGRWPAWLPAVLLFLLVTWTFLPSLRNGFIEYDDSVYVFNNEQVRRGLTLGGLGWALTDTSTGNWHPLTWLTHMADAQLYGDAPWGHHLTSVLLHALNASLLFLVLRRMTGKPWAGLAAAALFGLHPMRVESVTWICERKDVLSGFFWITSLGAYVRYAEERAQASPKAGRFFAASLLLFAGGLMSKPVLVTFPFVLWLVDFWPLHRWRQATWRALVREKIPFLVLTVIVCGATFIAQKRTGMMNPLADLNFLERLQNAPVAYVRYLAKTFWPVDLCALYPHPGHWAEGTVIGAVALLVGISAVSAWQWRRRPCLLMGWLWFLGTLVPMIGLVQVGAQSLADRYSYLPSIGLWLALSVALADLPRRWQSALLGLLIGLAVAAIALTRAQISWWRNNVSVWRHAVAVTQNNYEAHYRLARALAIQGDLDGAILEFGRVVALRPRYAEAHYSLGKAYALQGRLDEALAQFQKAVAIEPGNVVALNNEGNILLQRGQWAAASARFRSVLEIQPDNAPAHGNLGYALAQMGAVDDALAHLRRAVELQPRNASAHNNLGSLLLRQARFTEAAAQFQTALQIEPDSVEARSNLGSALLAAGRFTEAVPQFRAAVARQPDSAALHCNLGIALRREGHRDEALRELETAVRLKPDYAEARNQLEALRAELAATNAPPVSPGP